MKQGKINVDAHMASIVFVPSTCVQDSFLSFVQGGSRVLFIEVSLASPVSETLPPLSGGGSLVDAMAAPSPAYTKQSPCTCQKSALSDMIKLTLLTSISTSAL